MGALRSWFATLADAVCVVPPALGSGADGEARVTLYLQAEDSDFVRFNRARVRQSTRVTQREATVTVIRGRRRASGRVSLAGRVDDDRARLGVLRDGLAADLAMVPEDPHLRLPTAIVDSDRDEPAAADRLPPVATIIDDVLAEAAGLDLVGFYAAGPMVRAFADSRGQRNWHRVASFHFDWSLYVDGAAEFRDRAVKSHYAGSRWDRAELGRRMASARSRAALLGQPARAIAPGAYRTWLEPMAVAELLGTLGWGGFGEKDRRSGTSTLAALARGDVAVAPSVTLTEATAAGIAPAFTGDGDPQPAQVPLIGQGGITGSLISPRTAAEFGLAANAGADESPSSLALAAGTIPAADALAALGDGLWIGNLWYLGYSDRQTCRMTGMTRFACFVVESGRIAAPITPMRFDDQWPRLFGPALLGLADTPEFLPSNDTWDHRHLSSVTTPGALFADLRFTL